MATESLILEEYDPGVTVYPFVGNAAGQVYDFDDDTWKAAGSVVDPVPGTVTELALPGNDQSRYSVGLDLALINPSLTLTTYWIFWRRQLGAAVNLAIDEPIAVNSHVIRCSRLNPSLTLHHRPNLMQDQSPEVASFWVWLEADGQKLDINELTPTPGIVIDIRKEGAGSDLFQATAASPNAAGEFYVTYNTPGYGEDTRTFRATINIGSGAFVATDVFLGAG